MIRELYFGPGDLEAALNEVVAGNRAEALLHLAAETLLDIIEYAGEDPEFGEHETVAWKVEHYLNPETALQSGRPYVVLTRFAVDDE